MRRLPLLLSAALIAVALTPGNASAAAFTPGAPGIGDPYFPKAGNGGYDVGRYDLDVRYQPATDVLAGVATITATATQNLSRFNLDLDGLTVRAITVDGQAATWTRLRGELRITPPAGLPIGRTFTTKIRYDGVPELVPDGSGFIATDDGALIVGEPEVAATWFPANDHPADKATFTFDVTVPDGLQAVGNGVPTGRSSRNGWTTWSWVQDAPMTTYLATASIGRFDIDTYTADGIRFIDAIDPDLFDPTALPHSGAGFALSQVADAAYKRLTRVVRGGQTVTLWVDRQTETDWDYAFVEARTPGQDDWTTLPDLNGHTSSATGSSCPDWLDLHPWLAHYQSPSCAPTGTSGEWNAATGRSDGWEQWAFDLSAYPGDVELSIAYVSDEVVQDAGVFLDDVVVPAGSGSTSFEPDASTSDGWTATGPPPGSPALANNWIAGDAADAPPPIGDAVRAVFDREPEILRYLSGVFGPYPFASAGGIVDDEPTLYFALENQNRPIYPPGTFGDLRSATSTVVHELSHQWYGDSLALLRWRDIWLNEGFATYAEWLWSEHEGLATAQQLFDERYAEPASSDFWDLRIGDPGPDHIFDTEVYERGAMTLQALRLEIGDQAFFRLLPAWSALRADGNVTTPQFVALAEQISGQQLDALFTDWLYTGSKPAL